MRKRAAVMNLYFIFNDGKVTIILVSICHTLIKNGLRNISDYCQLCKKIQKTTTNHSHNKDIISISVQHKTDMTVYHTSENK